MQLFESCLDYLVIVIDNSEDVVLAQLTFKKLKVNLLHEIDEHDDFEYKECHLQILQEHLQDRQLYIL